MTERAHATVTGVTEGETPVLYHRQRDPQILFEKKPITLHSGHGYDAHTLTTGGNTRSVVIVATRRDEVLLVHSYRPSLGELIWELPRGFGEGDPDDDDQAARDGRRELLEESGYEAAEAATVGEFVLDTTFYPSRLAVVRCLVTADAPVAETDGEVEGHAWFPASDLSQLIRDGVVRDGASLAALAIARV